MFLTVWRSYSLLTTRQKGVVTSLALFGILANLLDVAGIMLLGFVVAEAIGGNSLIEISALQDFDREFLVIAGLGTAGALFGLKTVLGIMLSWTRENFLSTLEVHFSEVISDYIFSGGMSRVKGISRSRLEWAILRSTEKAFGLVIGQSIQLMAEASLALFILILFVYTDLTSAAFVATYFALVLIAFQLVTRARRSETGRNFRSGSVEVGQSIADTLATIKELIVLARVSVFKDRILEARQKVSRGRAHHAHFQAIPRLVIELSLILGALAFAIFQYARYDGNPDLGIISIFLAGSVRMMSAILPLYRAYMQLKFDQPQARDSQVLVETASLAPKVGSKEFPKDFQPTTHGQEIQPLSVSLRNVSFEFHDRGDVTPVLTDVSLEVAPGQTVAIIGPSGAGKSTLVDITLGLYEPSAGTVLLSNQPPVSWQSKYPGSVGYVPQNPRLVSGSLRDNIALGVLSGEVDSSAMQEAIRAAQIETFVNTLPNGLETNLGEFPFPVSGGQMQRIGLARALYSRPKLLVIDEATSGLDAETEASVTESLQSIGDSMTTIVVAHRLSTIQHSDVVFFVDEGKILYSGTLRDLEKRSPVVRRYIRLMTID